MLPVVARGVDVDQRRTQLAHAVWAVIASEGIGAVSVRRVAAAAGVSPGRVQHYFPHKGDLLRHACQEMIGQAEMAFESHSAGADARSAVRELVLLSIPSTPQARVGFTVWQAFLALALHDEVIAALITAELEGTRALVADLVGTLLTADSARAQLDPVAIAAALVALGHGLAQHVTSGSLTPQEAATAVDETLQALLGRPPSPSSDGGR